MTATQTTQTLPQAGTWTFDTSHSSVEFAVRHLMMAKVRGTFREFTGSIDIGATPEESSVAVEIQVASLSTRDEPRDAHLTSADFFDAERFPTIAFRSTAVRPQGGDRYAVDGDLTVRGVTRPVTLDLAYEGTARDPWGKRAGRVLGRDRGRPRGVGPDVEPGARDRRRARRQVGQDPDRGRGGRDDLGRLNPGA